MSNSEDDEIEKARRWNTIMEREQAKEKAQDRGGEVIEHNGVLAVSYDSDEQDNEWMVMEDCPDDLNETGR